MKRNEGGGGGVEWKGENGAKDGGTGGTSRQVRGGGGGGAGASLGFLPLLTGACLFSLSLLPLFFLFQFRYNCEALNVQKCTNLFHTRHYKMCISYINY